jgi:hypothetical protein
LSLGSALFAPPLLRCCRDDLGEAVELNSRNGYCSTMQDMETTCSYAPVRDSITSNAGRQTRRLICSGNWPRSNSHTTQCAKMDWDAPGGLCLLVPRPVLLPCHRHSTRHRDDAVEMLRDGRHHQHWWAGSGVDGRRSRPVTDVHASTPPSPHRRHCHGAPRFDGLTVDGFDAAAEPH